METTKEIEKRRKGDKKMDAKESRLIKLNLTQHKVSFEQVQEGVIDLPDPEEVRKFLTFEELPTGEEVRRRAKALAELALAQANRIYPSPDGVKVMVGGALYLMSPLEAELKAYGLQPIYAFSQRISEEKEVNGEVIKTQVFKHIGFIEV